MDIFTKQVTSFSKTLLFVSVLHFFCFFENLFGKIDLSMNSGWRRVGDSWGYLEKIFHFKNSTKMVSKVGQFKKLTCREGSRLCKLSQLWYHFLLNFGKKNILVLHIPSYTLPFAVRNSLTNQFYQKD